MKSLCPDVNVWLALAYEGHQHHRSAQIWFDNLDSELACFCRLTQLSFLRLLTHPSVMKEEVRSQSGAWEIYDYLLQDERVSFQPEGDPKQVESALRKFTASNRASPQGWPDAYLAAFVEVERLKLVTFDRGLYSMSKGAAILLS